MKKNIYPNFVHNVWFRAWLGLIALLSFDQVTFATTRTWIGGVSGYWGDGSNWSPNGLPQDGDDLVFNNSPGANLTNNLSNLSVRSLRFNHSGAIWGYDLTVAAVINADSVDSGPLALNFGTMNVGGAGFTISENDTTGYGLTLNCQVNLNGNNLTIDAGSTSGGVSLRNRIFGTGGLTFSMGSNYISNFGFNPNSFSGSVTVTGGTLGIGGPAKPAIPGNLYIGFGGSVVSFLDFETGPNTTVQIYSGGSFLLDGHTTSIGDLVMSNFVGDAVVCSVDSGSGGLLGINGAITSYNESASLTPLIQGTLSLNIFNPIWTVSSGVAYAGLDVPGTLSGNGFSKGGNGAMILRGTNTFAGGVEVDQGVLDIRNSSALNGSSGVGLYGSGSMLLRASIDGKPLAVRGNEQFTQETAGSLLTASAAANVTWSGSIQLDTNLVVDGSALTLSGVISGPGGLDVRNYDTAVLGGISANTFTGNTLARGVLLELGKPSNVRALNGPLVVGGGLNPTCEVRWLNNWQDVDDLIHVPSFTIETNGLINLNNHLESFGPITFNGGTLDSGLSGVASMRAPITVNPGCYPVISGVLSFDPAPDPNAVFNVGVFSDLYVGASIQGTLNPPQAYFVKEGFGTMALAGNNTYDAVTLVQQGILRVENSSGLGTTGAGTVVSVGAGVWFEGSGTNSEGFEIAGTGYGDFGALLFDGANWTLNGNIILDGPTTIGVSSNGYSHDINGPISPADPVSNPLTPLTKIGRGSLVFGGTAANTYNGTTTVANGELKLAKPDGVNAIPGELFVGVPNGNTSATCTSLNNYQVYSGLTVYPGSVLNLNGFQENTDFLNLYGNATVLAGGANGYLSLKTGGDIIVYPSGNNSAWIDGTISLDPGNHHFNITSNISNSVGLLVTATISQYSGAASIEKTGPGVMELHADNTFGDNVYVSDGTLIASRAGALSSQNIYVLNNASLYLSGGYSYNLATLVLNSSNPLALQSRGGSNTWSGVIGLYQPTTVYVDSGAFLQVLNSISGSGGLTKTGTGRLQFWGSVPNVYVGGTTVSEGTLEAGRVIQVSVPGDVVVGGDADSAGPATLVVDREQQFSAGANVAVRKSGILRLNSNPSLGVPVPTIGTLTGGGNLALGPANASLTVNNTVFCAFPGVISGSGEFIKDGPAKMRLTGNNTYTGNTVINGGTLQVDGSQIPSPVQVNAGKLEGTGSVGTVDMNSSSAVVEPGDSPGILNCGNFNPDGLGGGYLNFQLNGLVPGTGYDQLYVLGNVNLTGITLAGSLGFNSALSNSFTIIQNDGTDPITGTFVGLPQNGTVTIGWQQFRINYTGGDGNDVVLTQISSNSIPPCDPAPSGLVAWWPGAGNANDIIGGNNGVAQNGATFVPGKVGQAFSFDGVNDQVVVPGFCNLVPTNEITVEFWQKAATTARQWAFGPSDDNASNIFDVSCPWVDGKVYWEFGNTLTSGQLSYTPTNSIIGTWQHFACVASQSGNYMKIYRNGVLEAQKSGMTPYVRTNQDLLLGGAPYFFSGQLDELSIYNRALSGAEIQAIYNAGMMGKCLSAVYITAINRSGTNVSLTWLSQPGVTYRVQSTAAISPASWTDASDDIISSAGTTSTVIAAPSAQGFYRIAITQ